MQTEEFRIVSGLPLYNPLERQTFAALALPHPMGEQVSGDGRVADEAAMRPTVTEPEESLGGAQHLEDDLMIAVGVIGEG